ncbi:addiction module protein [Phytoactinopolyspora limicola]|uniref:addiction module protein n=1 Tax=Phytoactinopolyspora limicola TaxID=2715536 RepID=UPI0014099694|nr:addiction module protein [Phytoactinopolyspora limicola]
MSGGDAVQWGIPMTRQAQDVLQAALALPAHGRADVAAELLASLHDRPEADKREFEEAWGREIERRGRRVMAGTSEGETWTDVRARLVERLTER